MNPISNSNLADNKYYQFDVARSVGFKVPDFISSNDKSALKEFCSSGSTAIKFMTQDLFKNEAGGFSGIYVNKISKSDLVTPVSMANKNRTACALGIIESVSSGSAPKAFKPGVSKIAKPLLSKG